MKLSTSNRGAAYSSRRGCLARLLVLVIAVMVGALLLPGISIESAWAVLLTAIVISLLDNLIRPILIVITLPATVLTLGLFLFVINAVVILMASAIVGGFHVDNIGSALLFSLVLMAINYLLELPYRYIDKPPLTPADPTSDDDDDTFTPYEEIKD